MISFRWSYIAAPLAVLIIAVILGAFFYRLLPADVAYSFDGGSPRSWLGRGAITAWLVVPQFILTLLAMAVIGSSIWFSRHYGIAASPGVFTLLKIMGNMLVLPQLILLLASADIYSYNAYQAHFLPLWASAVTVLILGGIILAVLFAKAFKGRST